MPRWHAVLRVLRWFGAVRLDSRSTERTHEVPGSPVGPGVVAVRCVQRDDAATTSSPTQAEQPTAGTGAQPPGATATPGIPELAGEIAETASGLRYIDERAGTGPSPKLCIAVHYTGWLEDGTLFESTKTGPPFVLPLNRVIPGWAEGVGSMKEGGKRRLIISPALGYGPGGRPPNIPERHAHLRYRVGQSARRPVLKEATPVAGRVRGGTDKIASCPEL